MQPNNKNGASLKSEVKKTSPAQGVAVLGFMWVIDNMHFP